MSTGEEQRPLRVDMIGETIHTPPISPDARREIGHLLRLLQDHVRLGMPQSRPMPSIGPRCHELRVRDAEHSWRVLYRIDPEAVVVAVVFPKKTRATPKAMIDLCKRRLRGYDDR